MTLEVSVVSMSSLFRGFSDASLMSVDSNLASLLHARSRISQQDASRATTASIPAVKIKTAAS